MCERCKELDQELERYRECFGTYCKNCDKYKMVLQKEFEEGKREHQKRKGIII